VPGDPGTYRRTLNLPHGAGTASLTPATDHVRCELGLTDLRDLGAAVARCRRLLDLDADPVAVDAIIAEDAALSALVAKAPGRRIPRTVDGDELALRAVLGQQVSTAGARAITARIAARCGPPLPHPDGGLRHTFPTAESILGLDDAALPLPARRRQTLRDLATAIVDGRLCLDPGADWSEAEARLGTVRGVGPWTASMIAMRALGDPDSFPTTDLGVIRGASALGLPEGAELERHSQRWRPWRSYATQYLWGVLDHPINRYPEGGQ
jgi:AraC family transcriptional regulator of adaptative response / DNA-3-methyladenine glycosylase II